MNASAAQDAWLLEQHRWAEEQAAALGPGDPYWRGVALTLAQLEGLVQGYSQRRRRELRAGAPRASDLPDLDLAAFLRISAVGAARVPLDLRGRIGGGSRRRGRGGKARAQCTQRHVAGDPGRSTLGDGNGWHTPAEP